MLDFRQFNHGKSEKFHMKHDDPLPDPGQRWYVAQAIRNKELAAAMSVTQHGFSAYVPILQRTRRIGRQITREGVPRFGVYVFVRFHRDLDDWGVLFRGLRERAYFRSVLCDVNNHPIPVPDKAMEAIRAFDPPIIPAAEPHRFQRGEACTITKAGIRRAAVFLRYQGDRQFVETHIFGSSKEVEIVDHTLVEPLDLDSSPRKASILSV